MSHAKKAAGGRPLYTPEERVRRDRSPWTWVQAVLAPLQFLAFLVSLWLVLRYLQTGEGATAATASVLIKTAFLYAIMVTGAIWEREVFGVWLFAHSFFWEDVVSMGVIALHTAYLWAWLTGSLSLEGQMVLNALQFFLKLREARLTAAAAAAAAAPAGGLAPQP
jgi:3-vinyl bacteriochlorophyllide hydratase